ncbi:MAG TPA: hypothetical protein VME17_08220 [Bryobacteraceae bacterium]|nr:hypothetical protein [Bryobacteraceae bacterium]
MKKFDFPLERVRRWRVEQAGIEELKMRQLRDRRTALAGEKRRVESDRTRSERQVLTQATIEASEVQNLEAYRRHAANRIRDIGVRERQCDEQILEQRQRWMVARQKAELLERLKQKAFEEWRSAAEREEENLAAELYLAKRGRRWPPS